MNDEKAEQAVSSENSATTGDISDPIVAEVARRVDCSSPLTRKAFEAWQEARADELKTEPIGTKVHAFRSAEVQELAIRFAEADVAENISILNLQLAQLRKRNALANLHAGLAEHDYFFIRDGDSVMVNRLEVWRVSKSNQFEYMRNLVSFSRQLAAGEAGITVEDALNGKLPEAMRAYPVTEFTTELGVFLVRNGEEGRELVRRICDDSEIARQAELDPQCPQVLKTLAEMSVMVSTAAELKPAGKPATVGFAAA